MNHPLDLHDRIELRAYELWEERGRPWGTPDVDWFRAEKELAESPSASSEESQDALSKLAREVGAVVGKVVAILSKAEHA